MPLAALASLSLPRVPCHDFDGNCAGCVDNGCHFALFAAEKHKTTDPSSKVVKTVEKGKCYSSPRWCKIPGKGGTVNQIPLPPCDVNDGWATKSFQCPEALPEECPAVLRGLPVLEAAFRQQHCVAEEALWPLFELIPFIIYPPSDHGGQSDHVVHGRRRLEMPLGAQSALRRAVERSELPRTCRAVLVRTALVALTGFVEGIEKDAWIPFTKAVCRATAVPERAPDGNAGGAPNELPPGETPCEPPSTFPCDLLWTDVKKGDLTTLAMMPLPAGTPEAAREAARASARGDERGAVLFTDRLSTLRRLRDRYACHAQELGVDDAALEANPEAVSDACKAGLSGRKVRLPQWFHASGAVTKTGGYNDFGWTSILRSRTIKIGPGNANPLGSGVYMSTEPEMPAAGNDRYGPVAIAADENWLQGVNQEEKDKGNRRWRAFEEVDGQAPRRC